MFQTSRQWQGKYVTDEHAMKANKMESFWMPETLKYSCLLYSEPGVVDQDDSIVNRKPILSKAHINIIRVADILAAS